VQFLQVFHFDRNPIYTMALFAAIDISLPSAKAGKYRAFEVVEARLSSGPADVRQNCSPSFRNVSVSSRGHGSSMLASAEARFRSAQRDDGRRKAGSLLYGRRRRANELCSRVSKEDYHHVDNDQSQHKEAFKEAIFELEYMVREPAEVLEGLQEKLSIRDLELVLAYFAQDGRDSWCALEVFDWMQRVNRVGDDTHRLMMGIMFEWIMKLVEKEQPVEDVKSLLQDMNCVGLKPEFHIMQSIIGTYWEKGRKAEALCFVKEMLDSEVETEGEDPVVFLILKMVKAGEQKEALDLVHHLRGCGFKLKVSAYSAALVAAVVEQERVCIDLFIYNPIFLASLNLGRILI
jgi:hypothetical protein